ncbi:MAG: hypothetical protein GY725_16905 [bacterium]|nr:hypothetical protein [bacterium]
MNRTEFISQSLTVLGAIYDKEVTPQLTEVYVRATAHIPAEDLKNSLNRCVAECKFFPKPAEIIERAGADIETIAAKAWTDATDAAARIGQYNGVHFQDPVVTKVIQSMGGWHAFCCPEQEQHWLRKHFMDLYGCYYSERDSLRDVPLMGIADQQTVTPIFPDYIVPDTKQLTDGEDEDGS